MSSAFKPDACEPTVPLHTEEIAVSRRQVAGDTVRVSTVTLEKERLVEETLTHERVEVERVPIGRPVDMVPPVREEGDTTIFPVIEEIVVVERRLVLKEEVHIRRVRATEPHRESVMVLEQNAVITRTEAGLPPAEDDRRPLGTDPTKLAQEEQK
jgi:stress response protein YsnF